NAVALVTNKKVMAARRRIPHNHHYTKIEIAGFSHDKLDTIFLGEAAHMLASTFHPLLTLFAEDLPPGVGYVMYFLLVVLGFFLICELIGLRYIPNSRVGIVEKLWSAKGSVEEGRIIALSDEAGYQADLLRGGFHLGFWRWQYRIHKVALVTVPQGK